jgi:hypothetical protein
VALLGTTSVHLVSEDPPRADFPTTDCTLDGGALRLDLVTDKFGETPPPFLAQYAFTAPASTTPLPLAGVAADVAGQVDDATGFVIQPCLPGFRSIAAARLLPGSGSGSAAGSTPAPAPDATAQARRRTALARLAVSASNTVSRTYGCTGPALPAPGQPAPAPAATPLTGTAHPCGLPSAAPLTAAIGPAGDRTVAASGDTGLIRSCQLRGARVDLTFDVSRGVLATYAAPWVVPGNKPDLSGTGLPGTGAYGPTGAWLDCPGKPVAYRLASGADATPLPPQRIRDLFVALIHANSPHGACA